MALRPKIFESTSPNGNVFAYVLQDAYVAYFYLEGKLPHILPLRSVWIRNLVDPPIALDLERIKRGLPALLPGDYCRIREASPGLAAQNLEVVWLEEGDAAALLEDNEVIAIIPSWSGRQGFSGYALECAYANPFCWPLEAENTLIHRVEVASRFWSSWEAGETPWEMLRDRIMSELEAKLGKHLEYYAMDGGVWPPKAVVQIPVPGGTVFSTVGLSLRPQPMVELYSEFPSRIRRFELAICLESCSEVMAQRVSRFLSWLGDVPWSDNTWLGDGHTIVCEGLFGRVQSVLLSACPLGGPSVELGLFQGDPINLYWLIPITHKQRALGQAKGAKALWSTLAKAGVDWIYRTG